MIWEFFSNNAAVIASGLIAILFVLGLARDRIMEAVYRRQVRKERRRTEEVLGSIPPEADLRAYLGDQEKLARLKVRLNQSTGLQELLALSKRERFSESTLEVLARELGKAPVGSRTFSEILDLLCSNR